MLKVQEIRELIKLIDDSTIDEFSYESNGAKVKMKKQRDGSMGTTSTPVQQPAVERVESSQPERSETAQPKDSAQQPEENNLQQTEAYDHEIVSPMVGTFYSSPNPESDPFVSKGEQVNEDTVVCIVEAMKLFNEIEAEAKGTVVEVLAENGELVEFGQPLFRVKSE